MVELVGCKNPHLRWCLNGGLVNDLSCYAYWMSFQVTALLL